MLRHLLAFYSMCVLLAEGQIGDGHIIQHDIEEEGTLSENPPDVPADHLYDMHCSASMQVHIIRLGREAAFASWTSTACQALWQKPQN